MQTLYAFRYLPWMMAGVLWAGLAHALSPDPRILSLIPHSAQFVDGSGVSRLKQERRKLLIYTRENAVDLDDFGSLVAVDDSRFIRQVFFAAGRESPTSRVEHSTLAIGGFNQVRIYRAAIQNGAQTRDYRGIEIIELRPFSRDQRGPDDLRWMAIIGSELALFGTVSHVEEELDRYLDHAGVNPALLQWIARLSPDDETWFLLPDLNQGYENIRQDLGLLDPRLLEVARAGVQFEFGIHYGGRIRLDYQFIPRSPVDATDLAGARSREHGSDQGGQSYFSASGNHTNAGVISVSRTRYEKWLATLSLPDRPRK